MKRILFVTSNRLGDAVLTTGVLHKLIEEEPNCAVTVVCGKIPAEIFSNIKGVENVVAISKRKYSLHWWDAFRQINGFFWHRIVDFRGSPLGLLPTRHRHLWTGGSDDEHKTLSNAKVIGKATPIAPKIEVDADEQDRLRQLTDGKPVIAIAPTANFPPKQWHHENYSHLAKALTAKEGILPGAKILVLAAPDEEGQALPVVESLPEEQVLNFVGKTTPMEAAALLSICSLFVGNDSGLMHTAVAVGIPTVGLFGIGKPTVYKPAGEKSLCLLSKPQGQSVNRKIVSTDDGEKQVIETLPVEYVLKEVQSFYRSLSL